MKFKMIRDSSRDHSSLKKDSSAVKSQLRGLEHGLETYEKAKMIKKEMIKFYKKQLTVIEKEVKRLFEKDKSLYLKISNIETVKALGFMTIIKVLSEVNGFLLFKNIAQFIICAGLDEVENQSGKQKGKTKISKKGNPRIRFTLSMPAMSASRYI